MTYSVTRNHPDSCLQRKKFKSSDPSRRVGPSRVPMGFRRNPDLARRDPTGLDWFVSIDVRTHTGPYGVPRALQGLVGTRWAPMATARPSAALPDPSGVVATPSGTEFQHKQLHNHRDHAYKDNCSPKFMSANAESDVGSV